MRVLLGLSLSVAVAPPAVAADTKPAKLALFDIEAKQTGLGDQLLKDLRAYLGAQLTARGFRVLPRTGANSHEYDACLTRTCQRRAARTVGADRALACQIKKLDGTRCEVTLQLLELKRHAAEQTAATAACDEVGLMASVKAAAQGITGKQAAIKALPPETRQPPLADPEPEPTTRPTSSGIPPGATSATLSIGPKKASVKLEMFTDFQCPFCEKLHDTLLELVRRHPGKIHLQHRDYPLDTACNAAVSRPFHTMACEAAIVARCAAAQGRFWEMAALLYKAGRGLDDAKLAELGKQLKLNERKLKVCLKSPRTRAAVVADIALARSRSVSGTPATLVNGQMVGGAQELDFWEERVKGLIGP
jgi:protein-disulfide isomerase